MNAHATRRSRPVRRPPAARVAEPLEGRLLFSTYVVTTLGDGAGTVTPAGTGTFNATTLRAAVNAANARAGADTIKFAAAVVGTIKLNAALPQVADTLTIAGPGASKLAVQRNPAAATNFSVLRVKLAKTATVSGLKLTGGTGDASTFDGLRAGGGIYNAGTLRLTNVTLTGNSAVAGGGVCSAGASARLTLVNCTVSNNAAVQYGGGIYSRGGATVVSGSTVSGNRTTVPAVNGAAGDGGGAFVEGGTLAVTNSTVSGNTSTGFGGGIGSFYGAVTVANSAVTANAALTYSGGGFYSGFPGASLTVVNSTLYGNTAEEDGGGVYSAEALAVVNCTLSRNTAGSDGGGVAVVQGTARLANATFSGNLADQFGGGVYHYAFSGSLGMTNCTVAGNTANGYAGGVYVSGTSPGTLANTIVAGNLGGLGQASDVGGTAAGGGGYNVIGTGGAGGLTNGANGNRVGVTAAALKLALLGANGGPTKTFALLSGSVAINAGSNALATAAKLYADQRGVPRQAGGRVDVGAFEVQAGGGSIAGAFFNDANRDGARQSTEGPLASWQAYVDRNNNGLYDPGELSAFAGATGGYSFTGLAAGTYRIREVRLEGWNRTKPAGAYPLGYYDVTLAANGVVGGKDFGNYLA